MVRILGLNFATSRSRTFILLKLGTWKWRKLGSVDLFLGPREPKNFAITLSFSVIIKNFARKLLLAFFNFMVYLFVLKSSKEIFIWGSIRSEKVRARVCVCMGVGVCVGGGSESVWDRHLEEWVQKEWKNFIANSIWSLKIKNGKHLKNVGSAVSRTHAPARF